ncbi:hypothetical protein H6G81_08425 [Scytonema hofmannii FACHB-248]|uniref:Uncharacterized protein n=1 Tax=Scytonema hofmannii FACHB-248 TaxID=1842502 RepID=A0ABR8GMB4_9CYAN|nr:MULTISPECIES: hypothetical protein [Nostocales]MBD2604556.1 hypothetical protein [Scytonema hofmannii FACHB-248]
MPHAPCPMPNAPCPMPHAPCPMPIAQCPLLISHLSPQKKCAKLNLGRSIFGSAQYFLEDILIAGSGSMPTFFIEILHDSSLSPTNY